ncbi:iron-regulated protein A [Halomonas cupida]|uniref:Iron-regulated protein A n=2 Tax=Halomonas cupida TaxID=44933 RepID=A0A1M7MRR7_9GAMM|nr:iron-regulated protein A [Halomonas cupida]SHM93661.1 hypothetical protein SAMN05660971_04316 [Halomonas cupida]
MSAGSHSELKPLTPWLFSSKPMALTLLPLALVLSLPASAQAESTDDAAARQRWHTDLGTLYAALATSTDELKQAASDYCAAPDEDSRNHLDAQWLQAYQDWQAIRLVDFGPIEVDSRAWQMQFWPDRKNLVGTRMASRLLQPTDGQPQPITQSDIDNAGVAEQGFPALEYLLYDEAMDERQLSDPLPCSLLQSISGHLADTSAALATDWTDFGDHYLATDSYTTATLHGAMQLLDSLEDKRLGEPLGMMGSPANHYLAEAWRSDASVALIAGSLHGLQQGFAPGLRQILESHQQDELADAFETQLSDTIDQAESLQSGIATGLEDDQALAQLTTLYIEVAQLRELLNQQIAVALGVVRGFNSSDGD